MARQLQVLIVEDSRPDTELCLRELRRAGFEPVHQQVETADAMVGAMNAQLWDVLLADYTLPRFHGLEALRLLRGSEQEIPFIVVTGSINEETAVDCLQRGADDYILKDNIARLGPAVERALREYDERRQCRLLEDKLRHTQRIETVGTLAAGLAHDFNNLLTAIFSRLDMARGEIPSDSPARPHLDAVEHAAQRALGITRSLLTFSRRTPAEKRPVRIGDVCRDTLRLVARLLPPTINQQWEIPDEPLYVLGDATQLQQVILNLLINARDAMPRGGTVHVTLDVCPSAPTAALVPPEAGGGPYVRLVVEDTGAGMSSEVRNRIFDPFFTTKPRGEGTGLGLPIAHGIVADHGGWIEVESELGAGSTFTVLFPQTIEAQETAPNGSLCGSAAPTRTGVLVVEDDELVRSTLATVLTDAGYTVWQAADGTEALEVFLRRRGEIRIVVADLDLPGMNGAKCLETIRAAAPDVRGLLVTAHSSDLRNALKSKRQDPVLAKPFQASELLSAVGKLTREAVALTK